MLRVLTFFIIFIFFGELIIRLDIKFNLSSRKSNILPIKNIEKTLDIYNFQNKFVDNSINQYRIMVLGDSYIKGIGINMNNQF